jgi:hypothetical protein
MRQDLARVLGVFCGKRRKILWQEAKEINPIFNTIYKKVS